MRLILVQRIDYDDSCGCHTVQLIPFNVLDRGSSNNPRTKLIREASEVIQKVRNIVGHFHHSAEAKENLREIAAEINESQSKLIQDNDTRWDSTNDMIFGILSPFKWVTKCYRVIIVPCQFITLA